MANYVCAGAACQCSFGSASVPLNVLPDKRVTINGKPQANITDNKPIVNVPPMGHCTSPTNPAVAAAAGVPQPCVPVTTAPWAAGNPKCLIGGQPGLTDESTCMCQWAGKIDIVQSGQMT